MMAVLMWARRVFTPCATSDAPGCASPPSGSRWNPLSPFFIALDSLSMQHLHLASTAYCLGFESTLELAATSPAAFTTSLTLLRLLWVLPCSPRRIESCCWMQPIVVFSVLLAIPHAHYHTELPFFLCTCLFLCLRLVWSNNPILLNKRESGSDPDVKKCGPVYANII